MSTIIIEDREHCLEQSPEDDDGDNTNKPSSQDDKEGIVSHYKEVAIS